MASIAYEIRWIDADKRYGMFATQEIPAGTRILDELAVMVDTQDLSNIVHHWQVLTTQRKPLPKTEIEVLRTTTDQILDGMQALMEAVKDDPKYKSAREIHKTRMTDERQFAATDQRAAVMHLPVELYKMLNAAKFRSATALNVLLQTPLRLINNFLADQIKIDSPKLHVWGLFVSLMNHGCKPRAFVSICRPPDDSRDQFKHISTLALHSILDIKEGQEITIEYNLAVGTYEQRREILQRHGIVKCRCDDCETEAELFNRQSNDNNFLVSLRTRKERAAYLHNFYLQEYADIQKLGPASFFQKLFHVLVALDAEGYYGGAQLILYDNAIIYSKTYNDNLRIYWFTRHLLDQVIVTHGEGHVFCEQLSRICVDAVAGRVWNVQTYTDIRTFTTDFEPSVDDIELIFMLSADPMSSTYHRLAINADGRPSPVVESASEIVEIEARAAEEIANQAAADLIAAEEEEAARKARGQGRKKRKAQRKKEREQAKKEIEEKNLAARIAAVRAATVAPALPLPRPVATKKTTMTKEELEATPTDSEHYHLPRLVRSSSDPERATVARFLAGEPLRPSPLTFRDEDCVSETGLEIRFGVNPWQRWGGRDNEDE